MSNFFHSIASSYISVYQDEDGRLRRFSDVLAPRFSIRDAPYDEGVVTAVEQEEPRSGSFNKTPFYDSL